MICCQSCNSNRLYIYSEGQDDTLHFGAAVKCQDCGQISNDPRAVQILREA